MCGHGHLACPSYIMSRCVPPCMDSATHMQPFAFAISLQALLRVAAPNIVRDLSTSLKPLQHCDISDLSLPSADPACSWACPIQIRTWEHKGGCLGPGRDIPHLPRKSPNLPTVLRPQLLRKCMQDPAWVQCLDLLQ
jgi:hypothetical protein